jgi:hypothetical protein
MRIPFIIAGMLIDGLTGIIYARAVTGLITVLLHMQVVKRVTGLTFRVQFAANTRSLASVCIMATVVLPLSFRVERLGSTPLDLISEILIAFILGAVSYLGSSLVMWINMGKPDGPEHEVLKAANQLIRRFSPG